MALFNSTVLGQVSGRLAGSVFSKNRGGQYIRAGTIPVTSTTSFALAAKARMTSVSQAWQLLTEAQRLAWRQWAQTNPVLNRLGQSITLTGHSAYSGINSRLLSLSVPTIDDPPLVPAPPPLTSITLTADIGAGNVEVAFTPTPIGASEYILFRCALTDSAGINYVNNYLRLIGRTGAAEASPFDIEALVTARLGTLIVGQILHCWAARVGPTTGLLSPFLRTSAVVVTT